MPQDIQSEAARTAKLLAKARRRWLFALDAACIRGAEALYRCGMRQLASRVEDCCPSDTVEHCHVCRSRELSSMTKYEGDCPVCARCIQGVLDRANACRRPDDPVMTTAIVHELLSLHRTPEYKLAAARGWAAVEQRDAADEHTRRERLRSLADLDGECRHRWILAVLPVATRLTLFMRTVEEIYGMRKDDLR